ncbi:uncharacterized protein TNCV_214411 [Trichonephila clavipes]|nr:uncharacterized protein TNCV_214411 [Trichonephila clavipes]
MDWKAISFDSRGTLMLIPNTLTANLYVNLVVEPIVLSLINSFQGEVFPQANSRFHTTVVTQHVVLSVDMLLWPVSSTYLSLIEHVWDIIERQLQHRALPAVTVLSQQVQQAWNSIARGNVRHLYYTMHAGLL